VRRLNRYVEEQAPWALARDAARAGELDVVLASLAEGLRVVTLALVPYMPAKTATLLEALGTDAAGARAFAPAGWGGRVSPLAPLFPKRA
jgi:methionyl-tRNA synthetase